MNDDQQKAAHRQLDLGRLVRGLGLALAPCAGTREVLDQIVQEAYTAIECDHLFLSRYEAGSQIFRSVAWRSSVNPGDVSLEQKFMGNSYLTGQPVFVHDLTQYNYRLRPGVARLGLLSMIGIPIITSRGVIGVLEAFSEKADNFSDLDADLLALFARQAAAVIERADLAGEARYLAVENEFILEAIKLEQASVGSLFYKLGETFASVLGVDGIAVFGVEPELPDSPLQEVMARGFSMTDVNRLKTLYGKEQLAKLVPAGEGCPASRIIKQSFRRSGAAKMLYTVPIVQRRALRGLVIFYWQQADKVADMAGLESFIERMIGHIAMVLGRKEIYANIQRISFFDLLTGLANRRLFDYVLDRELKKVRHADKPVSLLMIDVDCFKTINDVYGHPAGDAVLEHIGAIMKKNFRNVDLPARYGGEEFAVILPDTDRDQAVAIAERLRNKIAEYKFPVDKGFISATISIGGATWSSREKGDASPERLIGAADRSLYQAKQRGRNVTVFADGC